MAAPQIRFDNSYARLPDRFFARQEPVPVAKPRLIAVNAPLAQRLGLDAAALAADPALLTGNRIAEGASPVAQAYAGHQFGGFSPSLGDGRAILLGEVVAPDGARFDLALKGSGPTPFSRRGDGRAWLGPVLREYVVSEAMAALGVPTTRALAAAATGETVWRDLPRPGAVLTRVAASHIRVGTFQYFAARDDREALAALLDYTIARHYPDLADAPDRATALFAAVLGRQARLVARWMSLGFVHGVMNTDNMAVSGETIDYGPCAYLEGYDPAKVFSSIDTGGRYAYGNQPRAAAWNLGQFGSALVPVMGDEQAAVDRLTAILQTFPEVYEAEWLRLFRAKIGISTEDPGDRELVETLLTRMHAADADFTRTFRGLATGSAAAEFADPKGFEDWARDWRDRIRAEPAPDALMRRTNPALIARNHQVEAMIQAAVAGDYAPFERLNRALATPCDDQPGTGDLAARAGVDEEVTRTFCGT